MLNLPEATRKAANYLEDVGYPRAFLELDKAKKKDKEWYVKYDYTKHSSDVESVEVELDEEGSVVSFNREKASP